MLDDVLLAGERMNAKHPEDYIIVGTQQSREAYGCMFRKDDPDFKKFVNNVFSKVMTSGEADKIYKKWFLSPIPPKGLNMHLPMSKELAADFKHPNDIEDYQQRQHTLQLGHRTRCRVPEEWKDWQSKEAPGCSNRRFATMPAAPVAIRCPWAPISINSRPCGDAALKL